MPRIRWNDFSKGWWPLNPGDDIPPNALREAIGIRPFYGGKSVRSRFGMAPIVSSLGANIQSLVVWRGSILYTRGISSSGLLRRVVGSTVTDVLTNLGGGPLRFMSGVPNPDTDASKLPNRDVAFLFVVGGGLTPNKTEYLTSIFPLRKLDSTFAWSPMGLLPPSDNFTVGLQAPIPIVFSSFDLSADWTTTNCSKTNAPQWQDGSTALQITVGSDETGGITATRSVNLGTYQAGPFNGVSGTVKSSKQDWIRLWVHCVDPATIDKIDLQFDCTQGNAPVDITKGWDHVYSFTIRVADGVLDDTKVKSVTDTNVGAEKRDQKPVYSSGGAPRPNAIFNDPETDPNVNAIEVPDAEAATVVDDLALTRISAATNSWTRLRIPKMMFEGSTPPMNGDDHSTFWARCRRARIMVTTTDKDSAVVTFDTLDLHLGAGMQGDYKVALTARNSTTGTRSMPTVVKEVKSNLRQAIIVGNITVTGETFQYADEIEIWRTVGGGNVLFFNKASKIAQLQNAQIFDFTADFEGMQENCPLPGLGDIKYLKQVILPQDNVRLERTTFDIAGPCLGRAWSICKEHPGRVYYSPPGRLEVAAGYVDVTDATDPGVRIVYWNTIYLFTEKHIYRLRTEQEPFLFEEVFGAPGTVFPDSVATSKFGITYGHNDGVQHFDGVRSQLIAIEAVESYFQSVNALVTAGLNPTGFQSTHGRYILFGCVHEEEYFLSDGTVTLAVNLRTGVWRTLGVGFGAMTTEETFGHMVANLNPKIAASSLVYDEISTQNTDITSAIPFTIHTSEAKLEDQSGVTKIIQRFYVDIDTNGQNLSLVAYYDGGGSLKIISAVLNTSGRQMVEFADCLPCSVLSMRITGNVILPVQVHEIGADIHLPEETGSRA